MYGLQSCSWCRKGQTTLSKELEFSGEIQAVYLHKRIRTNPHFLPIWRLDCSHFLCHLGHLLSACHSLWPHRQLSWGRGAPCPSLLQEKFSLLAVCIFKISCWERGPQHTQIKGIPDNKAAAGIFCKQAKFPLLSWVISIFWQKKNRFGSFRRNTLTERQRITIF